MAQAAQGGLWLTGQWAAAAPRRALAAAMEGRRSQGRGGGARCMRRREGEKGCYRTNGATVTARVPNPWKGESRLLEDRGFDSRRKTS